MSVLTHMLGGWHVTIFGSQVNLECASKELEQNLEANLCDCRVVASLAEFVSDEGVLGPSELVEAGDNTGVT